MKLTVASTVDGFKEIRAPLQGRNQLQQRLVVGYGKVRLGVRLLCCSGRPDVMVMVDWA